jgi:hypothetical protein
LRGANDRWRIGRPAYIAVGAAYISRPAFRIGRSPETLL